MNLEYLKECRKKKFKNQKLAADSIGVSYTMYQYIEQGRRTGTIETVVSMCKVFEMDANILLNLKDNKE